MAGFRSVKKYAEAWDAGRSYTSHFRKVFTTATSAWQDCSMQTGGPPAQYYASDPLSAATLSASRGFYHGDSKAPARKYLTHFSMVGTAFGLTGTAILCDYVLYYPFIDADDLTTQAMDNTVTLPRYTDGEGLKVIAVALTASTPIGGQFTFEYVNQDGATKTSPVNQLCPFGSAVSVGTILTAINGVSSAPVLGPFVALNSADSGIRQINSVTFSSTNAGLMALAIVKPLVTLGVREINVENEMELVTTLTPPPEVKDGAYLNYLFWPAQGISGATIMTGKLQFIWDEGA